MRYHRLVILVLPVALAGCSITPESGTLAELKDVEIELKDETVDDGLEKAMESYRVFLEETPESAMTPEAIRRIADLTIEKEYGYVAGSDEAAAPAKSTARGKTLEQPEATTPIAAGAGAGEGTSGSGIIAAASGESEKDFEKRVSQGEGMPAGSGEGFAVTDPAGGADLENANARQAIELYKKLLKEYPLYERNDQVLYQMSRAYEELGQVEQAMEVMNQFVKTYPSSRYMDEVQFRRAEFFFTRKKFLDSEEAYQSIVNIGSSSSYYELALYKLGWSFYKQELYEEALHKYFALLDYKVSIGYDFDQENDPTEAKRIEDTYRVISLSFSNQGGPDAVVDYFSRYGSRSYEDKVYSHLGEFYLTKRRYSDAAASYKAFVGLYPFHEVSPHFNMRVIEIYKKGGFGRLVVESKKEFAKTYALDSEYWNYYNVADRPDVIGYLKSNLKDLANHYHALYQDKRFAKEKNTNYAEALLWYRNYLTSFPKEEESPAINYQMADLMLENKDFGEAAVAYENTAYNYPLHEKSSAAGYAAVYAYREHLKVVDPGQRGEVKQEVIRSSLKFADTYPDHEKVTIVLGAAADDLYEMKNYELAANTARKLIDNYPNAETNLLRAAWLVYGHSSFDMAKYADAENGYVHVLDLTPPGDKSRANLYDNLAASIYKQGEEANLLKDYKTAAEHFLRVGVLAPSSKIRPTAEYDGAAALIELKDWTRAAEVLVNFRKNFPNHELQPEVTKKIAFVYRSDGKLELAAAEYERIERESTDDQVRRGALVIAAELYQETGAKQKELTVYKRFVSYFPSPVEEALEIYSKMGEVYQSLGDNTSYMATLDKIVTIDKTAGAERTDRTRFLAAQAALIISKPLYERFVEVELVQPLKDNLEKKKRYMKEAINAFSGLVDYEVADVTAAATFYMAEVYYNFSRALMNSERPDNLSELQLEQYELALEDQIFPFEEKAIDVHKKNVELLYIGIYSSWIDKSISKLAKIFPAVYDRPEERTGFVETIDSFRYATAEPTPEVVPGATAATGAAQGGQTAPAVGAEQAPVEPMPAAPVESTTEYVDETQGEATMSPAEAGPETGAVTAPAEAVEPAGGVDDAAVGEMDSAVADETQGSAGSVSEMPVEAEGTVETAQPAISDEAAAIDDAVSETAPAAEAPIESSAEVTDALPADGTETAPAEEAPVTEVPADEAEVTEAPIDTADEPAVIETTGEAAAPEVTDVPVEATAEPITEENPVEQPVEVTDEPAAGAEVSEVPVETTAEPVTEENPVEQSVEAADEPAAEAEVTEAPLETTTEPVAEESPSDQPVDATAEEAEASVESAPAEAATEEVEPVGEAASPEQAGSGETDAEAAQ